jgi:hypothetical protein
VNLDHLSSLESAPSHALGRTAPISAVEETRIDLAAAVLVPAISRPDILEPAASQSSDMFLAASRVANLDVHHRSSEYTFDHASAVMD